MSGSPACLFHSCPGGRREGAARSRRLRIPWPRCRRRFARWLADLARSPSGQAGSRPPGTPGHNPEAAQAGRQGLSPLAYPGGVANALPGRRPGRTGQHLRIGIEADGRFEQWRQPQGHRSWPAADIEQLSPPVKGQAAGEGVGQAGSIRQPALLVVAGSSGEKGLIPAPRFPAASCRAHSVNITRPENRESRYGRLAGEHQRAVVPHVAQ